MGDNSKEQSTLRGELVQRFWKDFDKRLANRETDFNLKPPPPSDGCKSWRLTYIGHSFRLAYVINVCTNYAAVNLKISKQGRDLFSQLYAQRERINAELGVQADWQSNLAEPAVEIRRDFRLTPSESSEETEEIYNWLFETFDTFHKVFSPKINSLRR